MSKKVLFAFNLNSGKRTIRTKVCSILDELSKIDYEIIAFSTQQAGDAKKKILDYAGELDYVLVAGGDGTVSEAASAIIECGRDIPLVFIPCGSTNDYASTLHVSKNPMTSVDRLVEQNFVPVDIGKLNGKHFNYVAAFGLMTDISYTTDQNLKNIMGYGAYVLEIGKRLLNIPAIPAEVTTAEGKVYNERWFYGMVTNSKQVGGLKNITGPDVVLNDGLFEVTLVKETHNPIEFVEAFKAIKTGKRSKFIKRFKTGKITFKFEEEIPWTVDGEPAGEHMEVVVENLHKAVRIAIPKTEEAEDFEDTEDIGE